MHFHLSPTYDPSDRFRRFRPLQCSSTSVMMVPFGLHNPLMRPTVV